MKTLLLYTGSSLREQSLMRRAEWLRWGLHVRKTPGPPEGWTRAGIEAPLGPQAVTNLSYYESRESVIWQNTRAVAHGERTAARTARTQRGGVKSDAPWRQQSGDALGYPSPLGHQSPLRKR